MTLANKLKTKRKLDQDDKKTFLNVIANYCDFRHMCIVTQYVPTSIQAIYLKHTRILSKYSVYIDGSASLESSFMDDDLRPGCSFNAS